MRGGGGWRVLVAWGGALGCCVGVLAQGFGPALVTLPHVDAHGRGLPGVTRPMLMAGPGMVGLGGVGAGGTPWVNPHWVGASAMFASQLGWGGAGLAGVGPGAATGAAGSAAPGTLRMGGTAVLRPVGVAAMGPEARREADARLLSFQQEQARKGSPGAQRALAVRHERGDGVEKSEVLARAWREAADRSERAMAEGVTPVR